MTFLNFVSELYLFYLGLVSYVNMWFKAPVLKITQRFNMVRKENGNTILFVFFLFFLG